MLSRLWTRGFLIRIRLISWIPVDRTFSDECFHKWQYFQCLWPGRQNCTLLGKKILGTSRATGEWQHNSAAPPLVAALLLSPISYWFSMFGVPMLLFTTFLLFTAKTAFGTSSRVGVNILSLWMFPFITLGTLQSIWADCVHLPQPNRLTGATYILSIDIWCEKSPETSIGIMEFWIISTKTFDLQRPFQ